MPTLYDDIIHLPHHVSQNHPQMPLRERAAQFAPFAALTGYEAAVGETARLTAERRTSLDSSQLENLPEDLKPQQDNFFIKKMKKILFFLDFINRLMYIVSKKGGRKQGQMEYYTKRLTMQNIADLAGVDKAIVSKVINNAKLIPASREKVERVREIIRKYHYTPLSSAQSLATKCTRQIAFLLSDTSEALFGNPAFSLMLTGAVRACQEHRYQCQVDVCDFMNIHDFIVPENLRNRSIDGCILAGSLHDDALEKIAEIRMPIVVLGGRRIRHQVPIISRDSLKENGFFLDYALKHGHTRIWIASKSANTKHDFGILQKERPQLQIRLLDGQHKGEIAYAHRWAKRFLTLPQEERPTLIFGADQFCCVMARELARNGVSCPDQISFMCFSDTEMAACYNPALTVYSENHFDVGYHGAKVLFEILEKKLSPEESIRLADSEITTSNLIERESVKDLTNAVINDIKTKKKGRKS